MTARQLFDLQGNSFDHIAVALRVGPAVTHWLLGGELPEHRFPAPAAAAAAFDSSARFARKHGKIVPTAGPFPTARRDDLMRGHLGVQPAAQVEDQLIRQQVQDASRAAEHGRVTQ